MKTWFETSNKDIEELLEKAINNLYSAEDKTGYRVKGISKAIKALQDIDLKKEHEMLL